MKMKSERYHEKNFNHKWNSIFFFQESLRWIILGFLFSFLLLRIFLGNRTCWIILMIFNPPLKYMKFLCLAFLFDLKPHAHLFIFILIIMEFFSRFFFSLHLLVFFLKNIFLLHHWLTLERTFGLFAKTESV